MPDIEDEALQRAAAPRVAKLRAFVSRPMTRQTFHEIDQCVYDETVRIRIRTGIRLPALTAIILPRWGWIEVVRADMEHRGIQVVIRNLITRFPNIDGANDLAPAIRRAFPRYDPEQGKAFRLHMKPELVQ
jgi:hypothetical protein